MVARLLVAIASLHVDENEDLNWIVGQFDRVMNDAGAARKACCGPMKRTWLRDGLSTVEVVPTLTKHSDGHVAKTHHDDFIAAGSQQGLSSLSSSLENNFR